MSSKSIRAEVASAGKWSAASTLITTLVQFTRSIVLARLLTPGDIGLFAMAMIAVNLFRCFADGGMANAIIYKQTKDRNILSSIHWINVLIGILLAGVVASSAPLAAWFFQEPELLPVILSLSCLPIVSGWSVVMMAVLRTELRFRELCIVRAGAAVISFLLAVIAAWAGWGVYAFVVQVVTTVLCELLLCFVWAVPYSRPKVFFQREGLADYLRFGGFQMGEQFVNFVGANADYFIIGRVAGKDALGIYRVAFELVVMPLTRINPIVTNVVLPGFARLKDPERLRSAYLEVVRFLASVTVPCLVGLWAIAPLFVEFAYDARYASADELIRILVIVGIFRTLCNPIGVAIISLGRPDIGFYWNLGLTLVSIVVFSALAPYGTAAVAWGYATLMVISFWLLGGPILSRMLPTTFTDVLKQVTVPMLTSVLMGAIVFAAGNLWDQPPTPKWAMFPLVLLGVITYVLLTSVLDFAYVRSIYVTLRGKR